MKGKSLLVIGVLLAIVLGLSLPSAIDAKQSVRGQPACNDGVDNDGDGLTDYPNDPGCSSKQDKSELNLNVQCDDGSDNDGDSDADMADAGCASPTDNDESNCGDGVCEGGETQLTCTQDCGYPDSCDDSDYGLNFFYQGTVSGYSDNNPYSHSDMCNSTFLTEFYCDGTDWSAMPFDCSMNFTGCSSGACYW